MSTSHQKQVKKAKLSHEKSNTKAASWSGNMNKGASVGNKKSKPAKAESTAGDVEDRPRVAFTSGWNAKLNLKESLPIKRSDGVVVKTYKEDREAGITSDEEDEEDEEVEVEDELGQSGQPSNRFSTGEDDDDEDDEDDDEEGEDGTPHGNEDAVYASTRKELMKHASSSDFNSIRVLIANICTCIMANPQRSMTKKRSVDEYGTTIYTIFDLLSFLKHENKAIVEVAMYSAYLLFKDIIPGYRIRSKQEEAEQLRAQQESVGVQFNKANGNNPNNKGKKGGKGGGRGGGPPGVLVNKQGKVMLKKETKILRDSEHFLLTSYQSYIKFLESCLANSFGSYKKQLQGQVGGASDGAAATAGAGDVTAPAASEQEVINLGITALKCECELLKAVSHFNFRSILLFSVLSRGAGVSPMALIELDHWNKSSDIDEEHVKKADKGGKIKATAEDNEAESAKVATEKKKKRDRMLLARHNARVSTNKTVLSIVCSTLVTLLQNDREGEISYEIVRILAKVLVEVKYNSTEQLMGILNHAKLTVHQNDSRAVHKQSRNDRKKRKKFDEDNVESGLMEADTTGDINSTRLQIKRYQADCLNEICLLYFRIVKQKVGIELLPAALQGLGRITSLINMDTVYDLIAVLKALLENNALLSASSSANATLTTTTGATTATSMGTTAVIAPEEKILIVKLSVIHCAFNTLLVSEEGSQVLQCDDAMFIQALLSMCIEIATVCGGGNGNSSSSAASTIGGGFSRWDLAFQCINMCLIRRRESHEEIIMAFCKVLLLLGSSVGSTISPAQYEYPVRGQSVSMKNAALSSCANGGVYALILMHNILLRYPKTRTSFLDLLQYVPAPAGGGGGKGSGVQAMVKAGKGVGAAAAAAAVDVDEDEMCDLAMRALRKDAPISAAIAGGAGGVGGGGGAINNSTQHNLSVLYDQMSNRHIVWLVGMLRRHFDPSVRRIVSALISADIVPVPLPKKFP